MAKNGTGTHDESPWFAHVQSSSNASLRLFCFPYAGGSAAIFRRWQRSLPMGVEIYPVELPGHGQRFRITPHTRISELIPPAAEALLPYLDRPFAFFGHSMGALIGFELACYIRTTHDLEPVQLLVAGRSAPQVVHESKPLWNRSGADLIVELKRLKGTPEKLLEDPEAMAFWLPLLRADFELVEAHTWSRSTLSCPIVAYGGLQDKDVSRESIAAWRDKTVGAFCLRMLPGDHFFIANAQASFLEILALDLHRAIEQIAKA